MSGARWLLVALLAASVIVAQGCAGDDGSDTAAPLALADRVLKADEFGNFAPGETERISDPALVAGPGDPLNGGAGLAARLESAGFVSGIREHLVNRDNPTGSDGYSFALQLGSPAAATAQAEWLYKQSLKPCPGVCDIDLLSFDVDGIPGAHGSHRLRPRKTANGDALEGFEIPFADGPFVYVVIAGGKPGDVEQGDVVDAVESLFDRVKDRPAPGGSTG